MYKMSDDEVKLANQAADKLTDEEYESIITPQYGLGRQLGVEEGISIAMQFLKNEAARLFLQDKPDCTLVRNLAKDLKIHFENKHNCKLRD